MSTMNEDGKFNGIEFMADLQRGEFISEMSEKIAEINQAVFEHGQRGSITVKFSWDPIAKGDGREVFVRGDITKADIPKAHVASSIRYPNKRGELGKEDPGQTNLNFSDPGFDKKTGEVID